jgi:hypothetical protein
VYRPYAYFVRANLAAHVAVAGCPAGQAALAVLVAALRRCLLRGAHPGRWRDAAGTLSVAWTMFLSAHDLAMVTTGVLPAPPPRYACGRPGRGPGGAVGDRGLRRRTGR